MKEYVMDIRHLTEETNLELVKYAMELDVDPIELWHDICNTNTMNAVLSADNIRDLLTKYKKNTARNRFNDIAQVIAQATGDRYQGADFRPYIRPKRRKKKHWDAKSKSYIYK